MSGFLIHVGMPKTGTTFLQRAVFPHIADVVYLGKLNQDHTFVVPELGVAATDVYTADTVFADPAVALRDALDMFAEQALQQTVIVSTEAFLHPASRDIGVVASRIASARPDARILITIRSQQSLALSWYKSHGRFAKYLFVEKSRLERVDNHLTQRSWWKFVARQPKSGFLAMLDFHAVMQMYRSLFGKNVHILPIELLRARPAEYAVRLADAVGIPTQQIVTLLESPPENRGLTRREILWLQFQGRSGRVGAFLTRRGGSAFRKWLAKGPSPDYDLDDDIFEYIQSRYGGGNAILADQIGLDLRELGYCVDR